MLISKRSFLNLTRSKIGIIRIWEKRRTEGVEKSASRIIRAARFCSRRMRSKSVYYQAMLTALSGNLILVGRRLGVEVLNHLVLQGDVNLINFSF